MAESSSFQKLVHETSDCDWVKSAAISVGIHVFLEISFAVLEDKNQLGFCMNDIIEADDIDMFEFLHERDFADGSGWCPFFSIEVNLLESNDFICCSGATLKATLVEKLLSRPE